LTGITFYFSLPTDDDGLRDAVKAVSTPGNPSYRHFLSYAAVAHQYGATATDIAAATTAVRAKGLQATVDPSRAFLRATGTAQEWQEALGSPLKVTNGTPDAPFDFYEFPHSPKFPKLKFVGAEAAIYRPDLDSGRAGGAAGTDDVSESAEQPWPVDGGNTPNVSCAAAEDGEPAYAPVQIATAYGTAKLDEAETEDVHVGLIDLGGGYELSDVNTAADCFGYEAPHIAHYAGDGVGDAIANNNDETELDLQTMAAVLPGATIDLVQATNGPSSLLDAVSRILGRADSKPDVASISYGQCALDERGVPELVAAITRVIGMGALAGTSIFVSAGDSGSTTCGKSIKGPSMSFAASSPWVTAVGGTRLTLNEDNQRAAETTWNDAVYGVQAAGGGGYSRVFKRPWYQNDLDIPDQRAVPDVAALAAIQPGWPVILNGALQTIGGTSGASPFVAANVALLNARERAAGRPPLGMVNPWFYALHAEHPEAFFDVTTGSNDLQSVQCCTAATAYDLTTGLGVPQWDVISRNIAPPG
jgi:subtilase family serine protease